MRRIGVLGGVVFLATVVLHAVGLAQEAAGAAAAAGPAPVWQALLDLLVKSVVPALWVAVGPVAVAGITKVVNDVAGAYVPRSVQVVLAGVTTAVAAGLTGDVSGIAQAAGTGMGSQLLASTKPETLLTSAKPDGAASAVAPVLAALMLLGLTACKSGDGAKFSQKLIKISGDVQRVLVEGCDGLPGVTVAYDTLAPLIPQNSDLANGFEVGQDHAEQVCAKVKEAS